MAEEAVEAEAAEWAEAMVLILEANGNSIDTAAAIDRKYFCKPNRLVSERCICPVEDVSLVFMSKS